MVITDACAAIKARYDRTVADAGCDTRRLAVHKEIDAACRALYAVLVKLPAVFEKKGTEAMEVADERYGLKRRTAAVVDTWQPTKNALAAAGVAVVELGAE